MYKLPYIYGTHVNSLLLTLTFPSLHSGIAIAAAFQTPAAVDALCTTCRTS